MLYDTLALLAGRPLPPHVLRTGCRLLLHADAYGRCILPRAELADLCGGGPATVRRHLNTLANAGVLVWTPQTAVTITFCAFPAPPVAPPAEQQARSLALLTDPDVGLMPGTAAALASSYPFALLLRHALTWRRDVKTGRVRSPGALIERVRGDFSATVTPGDRDTGLWQRHAAALEPGELPGDGFEDSEEARRHKYIPDELRDIILG